MLIIKVIIQNNGALLLNTIMFTITIKDIIIANAKIFKAGFFIVSNLHFNILFTSEFQLFQ